MKKLIVLLTCFLSFASFAQKKSGDEHKAPNIIIFMVDDMGWQDTSVPFWKEKTQYNNVYITPNIEKLASGGVKFTRAYGTSIGNPGRTSLMTGMSPAAHRVTGSVLKKNVQMDDVNYDKLIIQRWNVNGLQPASDLNWSLRATTLPEILHNNGYITIHSGNPVFGAANTLGADPLNLGFDVSEQIEVKNHFETYQIIEGLMMGLNDGVNTETNKTSETNVVKNKRTITQRLTDKTKQAISSALETDQPFFLYMSHYAIHPMFYCENERVKYFRDKGLGESEANCAALAQEVDESLGELMEFLTETNQDENTIIIFVSDNGGFNLDSEHLGKANNIHNYPLNAGKGSVYEGGIRIPMIIRMPFTTSRRECSALVSLVDFLPTVLDMAGINKYKTTQTIEGLSLVPLLSGHASDPASFNRSMYWHFPNKWGGEKTNNPARGYGATSAIVRGDWKLIYYYENGKTELFNLQDDIFEIVNQARNSSVADVRKRLAKDLTKYLRKTDAQLPLNIKTYENRYPDGSKYYPKEK